MIISKKHGFVFSRVLKTGSTSSQAMLINSGILGPDDIYSGYRNHVDEEPTMPQNMPASINGQLIRDISPYDIPKEIYVKGDGTFPLLGHSTPTEMVRLGLLTEKELMSYTVIGTLREPIDRFLSAWFFYCDLVDRPKTKEGLLSVLSGTLHFPNTFLGKTQKNFFEYEGRVLKNIQVINFANLNEELARIIKRYGGMVADYPRLKNHTRPDWAKKPYRNWLSADIINKLQDFLWEDVDFYNKHVGQRRKERILQGVS